MTISREKLPVQIVNLTELAYQQFVSSTPSSIMPAVRTSALMDTFDSIYFHAMKKLEVSHFFPSFFSVANWHFFKGRNL